MSVNLRPWDDTSRREYERDFQVFSLEHGVHCVPIDEEELNRQAEFYSIISRLFEWQLFLPGELSPEHVLECGSGSGLEWAEDVMERMDGDCEIVAVDIFQLEASPEVFRKRWNLNEPFRHDRNELAKDRYDLVNSRFLADGIDKDRWPSYVQDLYSRTKPGGWLQMVEAQLNIQSDSGRPLVYLSTWWNAYSQALEKQNKDPRAGRELRRHMHNAGFKNIREAPRRLPVGDWSQDSKLREIGRDMRAITGQTLRSLGVWPCRHTGGMGKAEFDALINGCERELYDGSLRLYIQLYVVWGQRLEDGQKGADDVETSYMPSPGRPPLPAVDWK